MSTHHSELWGGVMLDTITRAAFLALMVLSIGEVAPACAGNAARSALASEGQEPARVEPYHEALFRTLVETRCQVMLCLLSIDRRPVSQEVLRRLDPFGRVSTTTPDDFIVEDGAVRGFSKRQGKIVNIESFVVQKSRATAEVAFLTTGLGSTVCTYHLRLSSGEWLVEQEATRCTL